MVDKAEYHWKDVVVTLIGIGIIFTLGGYFGYRIQEVQNVKLVSDLQAQVITAETTSEKSDTTQLITHDIPEVSWLPPGGGTSCPDTHPVKGKFTSTGNIAYTTTNKTYKRITAHICFASIDYATNVAGFFAKQD